MEAIQEGMVAANNQNVREMTPMSEEKKAVKTMQIYIVKENFKEEG